MQNDSDQYSADTEPLKKKKHDWVADLYEWAETLVLVPIAVILCFTFLFRTSIVSGSSMETTLFSAERLIVSNAFYNPEYGDIVVFTQPNFSNDPLVKRVIATEGQIVDIDFDSGVVSVDGLMLDEPYTVEPTYLKYDTDFPITIKPGHIFVMGDNRNGSIDSRESSIGQIDERMLMGKAYLRMSPFTYFG